MHFKTAAALPDAQPDAVASYLALGDAYHGDTLGGVSVGGVERFHALFGGAYGSFESALQDQTGVPVPPAALGLFSNQFTFGSAIGGSIDLNRSPRWVFRITPDALMKWYSINYGQKYTQWDVNFGISVGVEYKFKRKR